MDKFRKIIDAQTDKACGANKGISSVPLWVRFYSKKMLNLLIVDLPEIVKNPIGDQPKDIEQKIAKMLYIKYPNALQSLFQRQLMIQPTQNHQNQREKLIDIITIGVLTQVDLVDQKYSQGLQQSLEEASPRPQLCVSSPSARATYLSNNKQSKYDSFESMNNTLISLINWERKSSSKDDEYSSCQAHQNVASFHSQKHYLSYPEQKGSMRRVLNLLTDKRQKGSRNSFTSTGLQICQIFIEMIEGKYGESREAAIGARIEYIFSQIFIKSINRMNPFQYLTLILIQGQRQGMQNIQGNLYFCPFQNLIPNFKIEASFIIVRSSYQLIAQKNDLHDQNSIDIKIRDAFQNKSSMSIEAQVQTFLQELQGIHQILQLPLMAKTPFSCALTAGVKTED